MFSTLPQFQRMMYYDEIYGPVKLEETIVSLMESEPIQRLKKISQVGAISLANSNLNHSRYDHSVGVMLLIKKLNGSIKEQVAGLLHDISHTAFSHLIDYILGNQVEDYHETIYKRILSHPTIGSILTNSHLQIGDFFELDQYTILEYPLPALCADRIDYTLRDLFKWEHITKTEIDWFLDGLLVLDGKIVVKHLDYARWFKEKYTFLVAHCFNSEENRRSNAFMTSIIQKYFQSGQVTLDDFNKDDVFLVNKLEGFTGYDLRDLYRRQQSGIVVTQDFTLKKRTIDPDILVGEKTIKLSDILAARQIG